ncbi:MAG: thiamine pyrophosphate-binding protein [Gemmataceae bacterium]
MLDGPGAVSALVSCGVTHVIWLPDSELGRWEGALSSSRELRLIRVCREGEAMAIAAGLMLGGKRPVVMLQCTGFFEAGDAFRNVVHDLKLPLFLVIGMRSWKSREATFDSCPVFAEPILKAWKLDYTWLGEADLAAAYRRAQETRRAAAVLLPEGSP